MEKHFIFNLKSKFLGAKQQEEFRISFLESLAESRYLVGFGLSLNVQVFLLFLASFSALHVYF